MVDHDDVTRYHLATAEALCCIICGERIGWHKFEVAGTLIFCNSCKDGKRTARETEDGQGPA